MFYFKKEEILFKSILNFNPLKNYDMFGQKLLLWDTVFEFISPFLLFKLV